MKPPSRIARKKRKQNGNGIEEQNKDRLRTSRKKGGGRKLGDKAARKTNQGGAQPPVFDSATEATEYEEGERKTFLGNAEKKKLFRGGGDKKGPQTVKGAR